MKYFISVEKRNNDDQKLNIAVRERKRTNATGRVFVIILNTYNYAMMVNKDTYDFLKICNRQNGM